MMKEKITNIINYINLGGGLYLSATALIDSFNLYRIGVYIFFVSYIAEFVLEKKWQNVTIGKRQIYYLAMLVFFLLAVIYYPFDSSTYYKQLIEYRYPLLGFSVAGFFGLNKKYKLNYFLNTFIISSAAVILYLIFFKIGVKEFIFNPERDKLFTFNRVENINQHMMFNFFLNISLISIWYIVTRSWSRIVKWKRCLYIGALALIFFILNLTEGRSGFLAGILLMLAFVFFEIWKRRKILGLVIALLIPFLLVFAASNHERLTKEQIKEEGRLFLWEAAIHVIKEQPILGSGISSAQEKYDIERNKVETEGFRWYFHEFHKAKIIDSHNQYLQITMEFGIIGLALLLFLYIYPFFIAEEKIKLFSFFILFLCAYQSIFDMFITGQFCTLFCILTLLILCVENNIDVEKKEKLHA